MQVKASWPELAGSASSCFCTALKEHKERPTDHPVGLAKKMCFTKLIPVFSYYLLESQLLPLQCSIYWGK